MERQYRAGLGPTDCGLRRASELVASADRSNVNLIESNFSIRRSEPEPGGMTGSNWRRSVRVSIAIRTVSWRLLAPLVGSNHCCCIVSSIWRSRDAAQTTVFFGSCGTAAECATGSGRRTQERTTAACERIAFDNLEARGHSFTAASLVIRRCN